MIDPLNLPDHVDLSMDAKDCRLFDRLPGRLQGAPNLRTTGGPCQYDRPRRAIRVAPWEIVGAIGLLLALILVGAR